VGWGSRHPLEVSEPLPDGSLADKEDYLLSFTVMSFEASAMVNRDLFVCYDEFSKLKVVTSLQLEGNA
jgi:hypothetical protein